MTVEIRDNGRLEIRLTPDSRPVHDKALEVAMMALEKGQTVKVEKTEQGIAVVVEG